MPLIGSDADVSQSHVHVRQSGVSIMYCCFDDAQLENTKATNPVIHKCSIGISKSKKARKFFLCNYITFYTYLTINKLVFTQKGH